MLNNLTNAQKNLIVIILAVVVFVASTAASYSVFASKVASQNGTQVAGGALPTANDGTGEDPNQPKTESCPLNGSMHTKAAKDAWDKQRPLAVMIENSLDARPQSGLTSADVVYEAVAEGGITRFMALFYCNMLSDVQVGPVRSSRTYFLDWLSEYDALYAHVGGANTPGPANALQQIVDYKIKDLNQFSIGFPTFWRDYDRLPGVATEHTMYSTTQKLWAVGDQRGWGATDDKGVNWATSFVPWKFKDPGSTTGTDAKTIEVHFWESVGYASDYNVVWNYDTKCNCYQRVNGGKPHMDKDNNKQLSPTNVVVQEMAESHANDGYENNAHLLYANKGQGKAHIFMDGKEIEGTWNKSTRLAREKFLDKSGKEIQFNKGQIWIESIPTGSTVKYS